MTTEQKIVKAKVGVLELAKQLGNVSLACQLMGYSRDSVYRVAFRKEIYWTLGELQADFDAWMEDYNQQRPDSTSGDMTPMEFIHNHQNRAQAAQELTSLAVV